MSSGSFAWPAGFELRPLARLVGDTWMLLADGASPEGIPGWLAWVLLTFVPAALATPFVILWRIEKVRHRGSINDLERRNKEELEAQERRNKEELDALERRRISDLQDQARRNSDDDREQRRREKGDELERARTIFQNGQVRELVKLMQDQLRDSKVEIQSLKDQLEKLLSKP